MFPGWTKQDPRRSGEGVPTDLRGELTESQLRKSKNLAKRRLQKVLTKCKKTKRQTDEPCESDKFSEKATAEIPYEKQKEEAKLGRTLRKRHFAKSRESDKYGSRAAPIPVRIAETCGELRRAPARPSGKTEEPQPGQLHAPWPTTGAGDALLCTVLESIGEKWGPFSNLNFFVKICRIVCCFFQNLAIFFAKLSQSWPAFC